MPSVAESALFGTKLMDDFFQVATGGDIAFLNGVLKYLIEQDWVDHDFIAAHTSASTSWWPTLDRAGLGRCSSGSVAPARDDMRALRRAVHGARKTAILVWSMGITQHAFGVDNVQRIVNLGAARGLGSAGSTAASMPIRGHSGVQGGAEMGAVPRPLPRRHAGQRGERRALRRALGLRRAARGPGLTRGAR